MKVNISQLNQMLARTS